MVFFDKNVLVVLPFYNYFSILYYDSYRTVVLFDLAMEIQHNFFIYYYIRTWISTDVTAKVLRIFAATVFSVNYVALFYGRTQS